MNETPTWDPIVPLDYQFCYSAFSNVSQRPDERAKRCMSDYEGHLTAFRAQVESKMGERDIAGVEADEVIKAYNRYAAKYRERYMAYLGAESRCASAFVTGPSNFPVRQQEKRHATQRRRLDELVEGSERDRGNIFYMMRDKSQDPIKTSDADAKERLTAKVEAVKNEADRMVELNARFRAIRKTEPDMARAFTLLFEECDGDEIKDITARIRHSWCKDRPYPPYAITNARARQKQAAQRLVYVERVATQEDREWEGTNARVLDNVALNRIQIFFPGKPDDATRAELKRNGFRWAPSEGAWQGYRTYYQTLVTAKRIAGVTDELKEPNTAPADASVL